METIDLFQCTDLSASLEALPPRPDPLRDPAPEHFRQQFDTACLVEYAVPHSVVPQLLRPVVGGYVSRDAIKIETVGDVAEFVCELKIGSELDTLRSVPQLRRLRSVHVIADRLLCAELLAPLTEPSVRATLRRLEMDCCSSINTRAIKQVVMLDNLTHLDVSYCTRIRGAAIPHIARLRNLELLDIRFIRAGDVHLVDLAQLTALKTLKLGGCRIKGPCLSVAAALPALSHLTLHGTLLGDNALDVLGRADSQLRVLNLSSPFGMSWIRKGSLRIAALTDLENLSVDYALLPLASIRGLGKLRTLSLRGRCEFTKDDIEAMGHLASLTELNLDSSSADGAVLSGIAHLPRLAHLRVGTASFLTADCMTSISNLPALSSVVLSRGEAALLQPLQSAKALVKVQITSFVALPDDCFAALGSMPQLESVTLSKLGHLTQEVVAPIAGARNLRYLSLDAKSCDGSVFAALKDLQRLEVLHVNYHRAVVDAAVEHLRTMPKLRRLHFGGGQTVTTFYRKLLPHLTVT